LNVKEKEEEISELNSNLLNMSKSEQSKLQTLQSQVDQLQSQITQLQFTHQQQTKQVEERVKLEFTSDFDKKIN